MPHAKLAHRHSHVQLHRQSRHQWPEPGLAFVFPRLSRRWNQRLPRTCPSRICRLTCSTRSRRNWTRSCCDCLHACRNRLPSSRNSLSGSHLAENPAARGPEGVW
jgi:hypothetical protein